MLFPTCSFQVWMRNIKRVRRHQAVFVHVSKRLPHITKSQSEGSAAWGIHHDTPLRSLALHNFPIPWLHCWGHRRCWSTSRPSWQHHAWQHMAAHGASNDKIIIQNATWCNMMQHVHRIWIHIKYEAVATARANTAGIRFILLDLYGIKILTYYSIWMNLVPK